MKNRAIDNMVAMWDGRYMALNFIKGVEAYLYLIEGPRSIIVNFDFDEDWNHHLDVVIPKSMMRTMLQMEDMFEIPILIAANYNDRQSYVKVMDVYMRLRQHSNQKISEMAFEDDVYTPKEMYTLLIKAAPNEHE